MNKCKIILNLGASRGRVVKVATPQSFLLDNINLSNHSFTLLISSHRLQAHEDVLIMMK